MSDWLTPVAVALDGVSAPCPFFFRDDDAGWEDLALFPLLDEFAAAGVVVDVAAIPDAVSVATARRLARRLDDGQARVHQHGRAHVDHEPEGRACEFGPSRSAGEQFADLRRGRERLEDVLGRVIDPVFTPPWNRCTATTADAVVAAGHRVLSRDVSAGRLDRPDVVEIPVSIDWSGRRKGVPLTPEQTGAAIASAVRGRAGPVGVMVHHAVMDVDDRQRLRRLLDLVVTSDGAAPATIVDLAAAGDGARP